MSPSEPQVDRASYMREPQLVDGHERRGGEVFVFDDQSPAMTSQVTAPGDDTMTGLGTPNGIPFIDALRSGR